jgi:hypothetical protein
LVAALGPIPLADAGPAMAGAGQMNPFGPQRERRTAAKLFFGAKPCARKFARMGGRGKNCAGSSFVWLAFAIGPTSE